MKSLLFQDVTPFLEPASCLPCRKEVRKTIQFNGRLYNVVVRDKISVEDPYIMLVKAAAFAIRTGEPLASVPPSRGVRDFLIRENVVV